MRSKIRKILIMVFLVLGIFISSYGFIRVLDARKCKDWTVVKGRIMDSYVAEIPDLPNNKTTETSLPDIKYEYSFKGQTYFSQDIGYYGKDTLGLSDAYYAGNEDQVAAFVSKYPINAMVDVYVNPAQPSQSVFGYWNEAPHFYAFPAWGVVSFCRLPYFSFWKLLYS